MGKDPAFLFYPGDWNLGTMHLSLLEKGAYIELLMLQFARGKFTLPQAKHVLNESFELVWQSLVEKFETDGISYWNERLHKEKIKRSKFTESRRTNANSKKEEHMPKDMQGHMRQDMENENENENSIEYKNVPLNIEFDTFWNLYDKKVGDKTKLIKKWNLLTDSDRNAIIDFIPKYIKSRPDKQFRKDPETFFNNRSWTDEIISTLKKGIDRGQHPGQISVTGEIPASFKK